MKPLTIYTALFFVSLTAHAQMSGSMRAGYSTKTVDLFVAPALNYSFSNITLTTELMVNLKQEAPVNFGLKGSYQYKFIEAGSAIWYQLYSTDAYDKYKNGWAGSVFVAAHWKQFFVHYEYLKESKISIGFRENL